LTDYLLELSFDTRDAALDDLIQSRLFFTASTGSTSSDVNGTTTVAAYFDSAADRDAAAEAMRDLGHVELHVTERERLDWLDVYQQSLTPLVIGQRFVVVPDPALLAEGDDRLTIIVPQEQAFGTGSHETTALCIELLESLPLQGKRSLDVGSGSGILALAMHRLGALRDNRIRNRVAEEAMPLFIGSVEALRGGAFDIITMNIIPEVILPLLADVVALAGERGRLILSGILLVKRDDIVDAARGHGLALVDERARGEWWAGVFA
jgi:ribosomal protein L11 methyltransferase